jgi:hypothetical protein
LGEVEAEKKCEIHFGLVSDLGRNVEIFTKTRFLSKEQNSVKENRVTFKMF